MLRKLYWLGVLAMITLLVLSACSNTSKNNAGATTQPSAAPTAAATDAPPTGETKTITVKANNFKFEPTEIHVKRGDKVKLTMVNVSGGHGIEIPDLKVKLATEGTVEFMASRPGTYSFDCATPCGTGHDGMVGKFIVD